jgi:hypothetical protein
LETVRNPFDNESTFLSTESRREQRKKGNQVTLVNDSLNY